jgi:hypothetical protein
MNAGNDNQDNEARTAPQRRKPGRPRKDSYAQSHMTQVRLSSNSVDTVMLTTNCICTIRVKTEKKKDQGSVTRTCVTLSLLRLFCQVRMQLRYCLLGENSIMVLPYDPNAM